MKLNSEELRSLYQRETARSNRRSTSDCLTEDVLARAVAGELDQSARERVGDHLASCSDCAREFHATKSMKSWADGKARPIRFYVPYAIAASLFVVSLLLGALLILKSRENQRLVAEVNNRHDAETSESRRLLEETSKRAEQESAARRAAEEELAKRDAAAKSSPRQRSGPQANVPIIDLSPQDSGRGDQNPKAATVQLSPDTDLFTLILNLAGEDSSRNYSLEVTDRTNRPIWTTRNLRKSPYNNFTIALRRRTFPAGEYRLKIYGLRDGRRQLIEEYAIRLSY
ncbi:MAG TPA: zf-HC2 domain-containing protein [Pyrinomonadaceae bacterium]|nr:zf-HC2 domain-containing protein [Pyrinomonadaceae bacterium]